MCLTLQRLSRCARMLPDPLAAIIPPLGLASDPAKRFDLSDGVVNITSERVIELIKGLR
jgi:hypothetical protein